MGVTVVRDISANMATLVLVTSLLISADTLVSLS